MLAYGDVYFTALVSRAKFALEFGVSPAPRMGPRDGSAISKSKSLSLSLSLLTVTETLNMWSPLINTTIIDSSDGNTL